LGSNIESIFEHLGETLPSNEVKMYFQQQARAAKEARKRETRRDLPPPYAQNHGEGPSADAMLGGALASLAIALGTTAVFGVPATVAPGLM
jgi:hypothetical protein